MDTTNIAIDCVVIQKKKKKKRRKENSMDVQMSGRLGKKIYFFSVLNEDVDKKDSDTGLLQRNCAISKGGRDRM